MIEVLRKIWRFAGEEQRNIRKSMVLGFFYAIYVVVLALVDGSTSATPAWQALALLLVSILGRAIMNRFSQLQQTHAGYFMVANKRLHMGDKLKRIPMGYFNDQSLGELTGIATTILDEVESAGAMVLVRSWAGSSIPPSCCCVSCSGTGALACWPWLEWRCTCCSSPAWKNSPLKSPPSASGTRPGWWRRCWSSSRA